MTPTRPRRPTRRPRLARRLGAAAVVLAVGVSHVMLPVAGHAQGGVGGTIALQVTEPSGIRRFGSPLHAGVPFAAVALRQVSR